MPASMLGFLVTNAFNSVYGLENTDVNTPEFYHATYSCYPILSYRSHQIWSQTKVFNKATH